jgi:hypothetical protein
MGVVHEESDPSTRDLAYEVVSRITFDKTSGSIAVDREHSVAGQIRRLYQLHLDHSTEDVRGMLTSFLAEAGIALRESGGVYFVPHRFEATLDALCKVVEDAGGNTCSRLPVLDTPAGRDTLQSVANRSLEDELTALQEELARFDEGTVRASTLERRIEAFDALRSRVRLFSGVLQFKATELLDRIAFVQRGLHEVLAEKSSSPSVPDAQPTAARAFALSSRASLNP